jgi:List-Bact-rpt repeat protein/matrixin
VGFPTLLIMLLLLAPVLSPGFGEAFVLYPEPPADRFTMNLELLPSEPFETLGYGLQSWNSLAKMALASWNQVGIGTGRDYHFFPVQAPPVPGDPCYPTGVNEVRWANSYCGMSFGDAIAYTTYWMVDGKRTEAHVLFDSTRSWNAYPGPLRPASGSDVLNDFVRVAVHEFGHVAGLDHPDVWGQNVQAIMNSHTSDIDTLQADDIAGAHAIVWTPPKVALSVSVSGKGSGSVTGSPAGLVCSTGTCSVDIAQGAAVRLTATPAGGAIFAGWGGDCTGTGHCDLTMDSARTVTATFSRTFTLTITKTGSGSGTVTGSPEFTCGTGSGVCATSFLEGQAITLTATPAPGSAFTGWSGEGCSGAGSCKVTMTQARNVTATFALQTYALTVSVTGSSGGAVGSSPSGIACTPTCAASYTSGTVVTLTPSAGVGGTFREWRGACAGSGSCQVTMTGAKAVTAVFSKAFAERNLSGVPIKAAHFTDLRTAITTLRSHYSPLTDFSWTDSSLTPGSTLVKGVHLTELRKSLGEAYTAAGRTTPTYTTDPTIKPGQTVIKASHLSELRSAVRKLECGVSLCASPDP